MFLPSVAATVLELAVLAMLASLHFLNRDYSVVAQAVSDYGVGRAAGAFGLYVWIGSAAFLVFAWLFWASADPAFPTLVPIYLLALVVARIGIVVFPADLEGQPITRTGLAHYVFAVAGFALVYLTIDRATDVLSQSSGPLFDGAAWSTVRWIVAGCLAALVVTMVRPLRGLFGLAERAYIVSYSLWFLLVAVRFMAATG